MLITIQTAGDSVIIAGAPHDKAKPRLRTGPRGDLLSLVADMVQELETEAQTAPSPPAEAETATPPPPGEGRLTLLSFDY